ncbi:MAG: orotidine-5'-phosphate decarboxylase [Pseudomonadales bacterium]|nr:orotidine-5'-phosphate decarboxylase [Pseudomonadales bacterium]
MNAFFDQFNAQQHNLDTALCVGLDPDINRLPACIRNSDKPIFEFNKAIVDATSDLVCCYKPQIAYYASCGAEAELEMTIAYIKDKGVPVLLDAKRGDIGSTAEHYARELFDRYGADAITVNPYMGFDSFEPYLAYEDKAVFLLCRTSNPGGADLQNLRLENGKALYEQVAELAAGEWNRNGNIGLVVGATNPDELARIREITGDMTFLVPGIGAQGGDIAAVMAAGQGGHMILSSSRAVLYASADTDFAAAARTVAEATVREINEQK